MVTAKDCLAKYGEPVNGGKFLIIWHVPKSLVVGAIPAKIYCNIDLAKPLENAFRNVVDRKLGNEIVTWDGCFNIRKSRGLSSISLHSWAIAIDINAATNGLDQEPTMSAELVKCFTDAGFEWGGKWKRKDGMHFQLAKI